MRILTLEPQYHNITHLWEYKSGHLLWLFKTGNSKITQNGIVNLTIIHSFNFYENEISYTM